MQNIELIKLGETMQHLRKKRGITAHAVACAMGCDAQQLCKYEKGYIIPREDKFFKFCNCLTLSEDEYKIAFNIYHKAYNSRMRGRRNNFNKHLKNA